MLVSKNQLVAAAGVTVGGAVAYAATGAGQSTPTTGTSWSFSCSTTAPYVALGISHQSASTLSAVQYGGNTMTLVDHAYSNATSSNGDLAVYELYSPPTGSQTVTGTISGASDFTVNAVAYTGVAHSASLGNGTGLSSSISTGAQTCAANGMLVAFFNNSSTSASGAYTSLAGGTSRYNVVSGGQHSALLIFDSSASTTFSANTSFNYFSWVVLSIHP